MARSLRQTLALKARQAREHAGAARRDARADRWDRLLDRPRRVVEPELPLAERLARLEAIRAAVRPIIEREAPEREEVDFLTGELEEFLADLVADGDWRAPLEDHILTACMVLGIDSHPGPPHSDDAARPRDPGPAESPLQDSA